jgi:hypothetical protein
MTHRTREKPVQPVFEKHVHTTHLGKVSKSLKDSLAENFPTQPADEIIKTAVSGQCAQCGQPLLGKSIVALANGEPELFMNMVRFRDGYCGSSQCRSYYYVVRLFPHPEVDWNKVIPKLESAATSFVVETRQVSIVSQVRHWRPSRRMVVTTAAIVVGLLTFSLLRQIYIGGRIPILREPAHFRVAPEPPGGLFKYLDS